MKRLLITSLIISLLVGLSLNLQAQDPKEIVRKSEEKYRGESSLQAEMTMTIIRPDWSREMSMKSWAKGEDLALILVTAPARDKGTTNLKREKEVWSWMPRIERTIKLPPSMMSQSWMGSDFTNEDLVREFSYTNDYSHKIIGDSIIENRTCWKIELVPKEDAAVVWGKVFLWIEQNDYLTLRAEFYDEDDYLVNVMTGSKIKDMDGRIVATRMEMIPIEEEGHKTIMEYNSMKFNEPLPESFFTVQNMKRVR